METTHHVVIELEGQDHIVRPVSLAFGTPPNEEGRWLIVAFDEAKNDLHTFEIVGAQIRDMTDADRERLEGILAEREDEVPTVSEPPIHTFEEGKNTKPAEDLTPVADEA